MEEVFALIEIWVASSRSQQERDMKLSMIESEVSRLRKHNINKEETGGF